MFAQVAECQNINKEKLSALSEAAKLTNTEGLLLYHNKKIILEEYYGIGHPINFFQNGIKVIRKILQLNIFSR